MRRLRAGKTLAVVLIVCLSVAVCACGGDPFAIPSQYASYRLEAEGLVVMVAHPTSWGNPHVDALSDGTLLTWGGPSEPKYHTSPVLEVALQTLSGTGGADCTAYLDKSVYEATGHSKSAADQVISVSGHDGVMLAFTYTVGFASEFGEKVPRPETRHVACVPTRVKNVALTIDLQSAENQTSLADAVFEKVISGSTLSVADKSE